MVCLPVTAPLRIPEDVENCINEFKKGKPDILITVTQAHRNPYFNMVRVDEDGQASLLMKNQEGHISRRQDAPEIYDVTTVAYVADPHFVLASKNMFEGLVNTVQIPAERSIDIDTLLDFNIAEFLMKNKSRK